MEKAQLAANRFQTEREDYQMDADRQREKCDKLQVCTIRPADAALTPTIFPQKSLSAPSALMKAITTTIL
jgi:hypothetical protein